MDDPRARLEQAVDGLFVNGSGERADRLVLTADVGLVRRDLGGWCRAAVVDRLAAALASPGTQEAKCRCVGTGPDCDWTAESVATCPIHVVAASPGGSTPDPAEAAALRVGDVVTLGGRQLRVSGMPDGVTVCRDNRQRVAVRNVTTDRLSYVPERRLLAAAAFPAGIIRASAEQSGSLRLPPRPAPERQDRSRDNDDSCW